MSSHPRKSLHYFTMIELLVVIAILAILMALIFPSLRRAIEQGRLVKCQANLHQLSLAQLIYVEDYGVFAPHRHWVEGYWDDPTLNGLRAGLLYPYLTTTDAYYCPTFALVCGKSTTTRSYVMNWNVAGYSWDWNSQAIWKPQQAKNPAGLALFSEENTWTVPGYSQFTINDGTLVAPDWPWRDTLATYHLSLDYNSPPLYDGYANVVFLDGHVEVCFTDKTLEVMLDE